MVRRGLRATLQAPSLIFGQRIIALERVLDAPTAAPEHEGDAFVIPPHFKTALTEVSEDLRLLEVSLPADFETALYPDDSDERTLISR